MEKQRVLHIITVSFVINHFFGKQFLYLKNKTGNEYHLGCSPSDDFLEFSERLEYIPFEVEITRSISPLKDIKAIIKIYRYIKKNKINKVVGHTPKGGMVAMIASFAAGIPDRIYFRHGIIYETSLGFKRVLLKNIDRLTGFFATKVVCVSRSVMEFSEVDKLNNPNKNRILGLGTCNGIDTDVKFNPALANEKLVDDLRNLYSIGDSKIVGYVGRLVKDKGIDELLLAWEIINEQFPDAKLLLVGPIEERDEISNYSKKMIMENSSIIFTDFVTDASPFFSIMDVFVLPTYREGFPTVALEASSMEIPVLITKATGCQEAIINNITGMFISHDVQDIAQKTLYYLKNSNIASQHGKQGRVFVNENFEQSKIWDLISNQLKI
ncbi:glycosyltransferase family 4 protein [Flavobacterium collinsii]|uniref:N, N'-diacetylbacillosaminyl-diphospho-undecaprenol alpha-1,3-N-acetylgalactosaminyltransferase n=1 Tax=Flavobacterium collinsii TaxID=1114861 RepID=A0A9W4TG37_9FLAO|nr:glycosyltransferase family 4 protein [Flavobacterium collinsii]CAI2765412.1 N, N'-diacetylbacillosaminyl-diphospho-undecaprenol alpha-1,3-N-acetylgalactosaminyltransferase [Flavobacterium collinsii]